jgi:phosphate transport system protein
MPNEEKALSKIRGKMARLSSVMLEMFRKAVKALSKHDGALGKEVILEDATADNLETDVTELCLRFLALYAPKAQDLRYVVAMTRISADMERVADHSTAMGRRVLSSHLSPLIAAYPIFTDMTDSAEDLLLRATDSLFKLSPLSHEDLEIDLVKLRAMRKKLEGDLVENLGRDPEAGLQTVHFLEVIRRVDRVGGHARNIAVMVPYITEGLLLRHRPDEPLDPESPEGEGESLGESPGSAGPEAPAEPNSEA